MLKSVACCILNVIVIMSDDSVMLNLMNEKKHHLQKYTILYKDKANEIKYSKILHVLIGLCMCFVHLHVYFLIVEFEDSVLIKENKDKWDIFC